MKNLFVLIESILLPSSSPSSLSPLQILTHFERRIKRRVACVVKALSTRPCKFHARGNDVCWIDALEILWMETLHPFLQSFNKVIRQKAKALYVIRLMWSENVRLEHWKRESVKKVHVLLHFYVSTKCNKIIWNHLLYTLTHIHTTHRTYRLGCPIPCYSVTWMNEWFNWERKS